MGEIIAGIIALAVSLYLLCFVCILIFRLIKTIFYWIKWLTLSPSQRDKERKRRRRRNYKSDSGSDSWWSFDSGSSASDSSGDGGGGGD